jgi:hypothetical protein
MPHQRDILLGNHKRKQLFVQAEVLDQHGMRAELALELGEL